jgi:hypothetical protein
LDRYGPEFQPSEAEVDARIQSQFEAGMVVLLAECARLEKDLLDEDSQQRAPGPDDI